MRPSSLGGAAYCVALCLSVCPSVRLSVRPVIASVTSRHLANYNDTQGRISYGHLGRTNLLCLRLSTRLQQQRQQHSLNVHFHHSGFYWNKNDGGNNRSYKICKAPVRLSLLSTNVPSLIFYKPNALPVAPSTERRKYHIPRPCFTPSSSGGLPSIKNQAKSTNKIGRVT